LERNGRPEGREDALGVSKEELQKAVIRSVTLPPQFAGAWSQRLTVKPRQRQLSVVEADRLDDVSLDQISPAQREHSTSEDTSTWSVAILVGDIELGSALLQISMNWTDLGTRWLDGVLCPVEVCPPAM
jgi:hypothetical protein